MLADMQEIDILASWRAEELFFYRALRHCYRASLGLVGGPNPAPYTWTQELKGKRVLVVHPFAKTIERQYREHRAQLFSLPLILPEFQSLTTVKAVQSLAGNPVDYPTWFAALADMERQIDACDYDIALIGCGAYGLPLAAHVKRSGKQAIHIGGALQIYFGVKGKRWEGFDLINEYWVSPAEDEHIRNAYQVESGCYW